MASSFASSLLLLLLLLSLLGLIDLLPATPSHDQRPLRARLFTTEEPHAAPGGSSRPSALLSGRRPPEAGPRPAPASHPFAAAIPSASLLSERALAASAAAASAAAASADTPASQSDPPAAVRGFAIASTPGLRGHVARPRSLLAAASSPIPAREHTTLSPTSPPACSIFVQLTPSSASAPSLLPAACTALLAALNSPPLQPTTSALSPSPLSFALQTSTAATCTLMTSSPPTPAQRSSFYSTLQATIPTSSLFPPEVLTCHTTLSIIDFCTGPVATLHPPPDACPSTTPSTPTSTPPPSAPSPRPAPPALSPLTRSPRKAAPPRNPFPPFRALVPPLSPSPGARPPSPAPLPFTDRSSTIQPTIQYGLTDTDVQQIIDAHNQVRVNYQAMPLVWDDKLAAAANTWANRCSFQHSPEPFGENIALGWEPKAVQYAQLWYTSEACRYDYNSPTSTAGHMSQMVWQSTSSLGCAMAGPATCPQGIFNPADGSSAQGAFLLICEYWQPGNVWGQYALQVKPPLVPPVCADGQLHGSAGAGDSR